MKKRVLTVFFLFGAFLLCGCSTQGEDSGSDWQDALNKAQMITVSDAETGEILREVTDTVEIAALVDSLAVDQWTLSKLPGENATPSLELTLAQEPTETALSDSENNGGMEEIGTVTVYSDIPYISIEVLGFSFDFEVPQDAIDAIEEFAAQSSNRSRYRCQMPDGSYQSGICSSFSVIARALENHLVKSWCYKR